MDGRRPGQDVARLASQARSSPSQSVTTPPGLPHDDRRPRPRPRGRAAARSSRRTRLRPSSTGRGWPPPTRRRSSKRVQRGARTRARTGAAAPCAGTGTRSRRSPARRPRCSRGSGARRGTRPRPARREYVRSSSGACTTPTTGTPSTIEPDRHADRVEPVHEVRGAVERVDEPAGVERRRRPPPRRTPAGPVSRSSTARIACFAREVGLAHPVARRLLAHVFEAAEVVRARSRRRRAPRGRPHASSASRVERAHARRPGISASASSVVPAAMSWRRASRSSVTSSRPSASRTIAPASMHAR